jgi:regulator of nonsense transcripts 1
VYHQGTFGKQIRDKKTCQLVVDAAHVICTTCIGCGDPIIKDVKFDYVLIDEATLAMESECLIALSKGATQLVLIGDPNQLAPMTVSSFSRHQQTEAEKYGTVSLTSFPEVEDLSITLFHRLQKHLPVNFLDTQYRMHPGLAKFASVAFYEDRLRNGVTESERKPPKFPWPDPKCPLCFIDVDGRESRYRKSYMNKSQAVVVKKVVEILRYNGQTSLQDIAIVVPYVGQMIEIKQILGNLTCEISSIDAFQGQEKNVIIFCTVRSQGTLGFLDDERRMNVLLTRAKQGLIGIGNKETMEISKLWSMWMKQAPCLSVEKLNSTSLMKTEEQRHSAQHRKAGRKNKQSVT